MINREAWLNRMAELLRHWFRTHGHPIPGGIKVTMAALKRSNKTTTLGVCHEGMDKFDGGTNHVFVSAYENVHQTDVEVVGTLVHELIHARLPLKTHHGKEFKQACLDLGLMGVKKKKGITFTDTRVGPELASHIRELMATLPPLPKIGLQAPPLPKEIIDPMLPRRFQCRECKTGVIIRYTSLERAGVPPCWNMECEKFGTLMKEVPNAKKKPP